MFGFVYGLLVRFKRATISASGAFKNLLTWKFMFPKIMNEKLFVDVENILYYHVTASYCQLNTGFSRVTLALA